MLFAAEVSPRPAIILDNSAKEKGLHSASGGILEENLVQGVRNLENMRFGDGGVLRGVVGAQLTAEGFVALGTAFGSRGKVALGWSGGDGAAMLSRALGAGICAGGGTVLAHDGCCPAAGSWLAEYYGVPDSLFVEQAGEQVFLHWFGGDGLPPEGQRIRAVERQWAAGDAKRAKAGEIGPWEHLSGVNTAYAADAARRAGCGGFGRTVTICVPGEGLWDQTLANALERMGCRVLRRIENGAPSFAAAHGGFWLEGWTEDGRRVDPIRMLTLVAALELERGRDVAAPAWAPSVLDTLGAKLGGKVLRLGRDKGARERYARTPQLRDALFAAGYLAAVLGQEGTGLGGLLARLPEAVPLRSPGKLMYTFQENGGIL